MRYLHTMVRVSDLERSLEFYCGHLGLREVRRTDNEKGRFTLVFLHAPETPEAQIESDVEALLASVSFEPLAPVAAR